MKLKINFIIKGEKYDKKINPNITTAYAPSS